MQIYELPDLPLQEIVSKLNGGSVMIYPTETVAGIGSIGSDKNAVDKVFKAKDRDRNKPVSYAFSSVEMASRYVNFPEKVLPLLDLYPGPITLIAPKKQEAPPLFGVDNSVGVRIPDVSWLLRLVKLLDEPIISTSANISGEPPPKNVGSINPQLLDDVDFLISWEGTLGGTPSTVVSCLDNIEIIRPGAIEEEKIVELLNE